MRKFDDIKRSLYGDDTATLDPDYAQGPSDPKATSLTNRLLEAKARINQQKLQVATEVFGNGHKNTAPVAEQKAYIKSPENTTDLPDPPISFESLPSKPFMQEEEPIATGTPLDKEPEPTEVLFKDLNDAADRYGVPKNLLKALAKQESNFNNEAVSETGVRGVLQVTEKTGKEMFEGTGVEFDVTNQDHQIEAGTKYLAKHIKDWKAKGFGDQQAQQLATASYNTGFKRVSDAISETGKALPTMEEIEEAGNKLFPESNLTKDGKKIPFSKEEYKIKSKQAKSFREGMAHWKKIHYQDGELQEFGVEGGDEFVTAGTPPPPPPPSEPLSLSVDDFEDEEELIITEKDRKTPGAIAKKVSRTAQKPSKPINVDKEWDKLLDTVVANDDVFLMGLSDGTESLKIAAKAFMKSQGVSGLTSPQALTYLNDNAEDLVNWIKKTSSTERAALEDTVKPVKIDATPREPTDISVPTITKTPIRETTGDLKKVPDIQERDPNRVKDQIKPTKIEDTERPTSDIEKPVSKSKDVRIIEEEPIVDVGELSPDDIYSSALDYYEKSATTDLDAAYESTDGFDLAYLAQKEIQRQKEVTQGFMPLKNKTTVVEQFSNRVFKHKDGTWTVRTSSGRELTGLDEIMAKSYADYDRENWASDPDAPLDGSAGQYFNQTMQSLAYPVELIASAFTQTPESRASIKKMAEEYKKYFPVNRASMQGASTALALISEQKGSVEAIKYAFNNIGTFLEKGFDSVGFTLALAVGNVPVQIGMLASLAHGKANTMKDEWRQLDENKGKELTPEIAARIEISAAFSMLAEKVSVQAIKGVVSGKPLIKVDPTKWMNKVGDAINRGLNKNLGTKTANLLLVKPITKIAAPLAGEGGQEVISQGFEHWGLKEEFLSKSEMVAIGIEGTLAAPGVAGTVASLQLTKEAAKQVAKGTPATRKRIFLEKTLTDTQAQLSKITVEDRINDLDQQINDLSGEVKDTETGVASQNKRFDEIYDTLRAEAFGQLSIPDAIKAAKEQLATELESLQSEKAQLEKDTKPLTFKDNEFLSRPIKRDLAKVEQQIEALKTAEPKPGETPTARNEQIQNLENRKKTLEDKLNSRVTKQQLEYLRQKLTQAKAKIESALETDLTGKEKNKEELAGIALDPKYGKELGEGELAIALKEIRVLEDTDDPGMLDPDRELDPIGLEATSDYTPTKDSGLEVVKETEGGAVTSNTVQLKEEPAEWTDEKTGRRLTKEDFDSPIEYQQFVKKTRKFDADRERGIKELKRIKEEKIKEISPEDINPRRQQLVLERLKKLTNRKLNDTEKQAVREKVAELKEKGVLPTDAGKKGSKADKLFSGPTAFADAQNATPEQLKEALDDPKTDAATKKHLLAIQKAQEDQKKLDEKLEDKTFADVHEEVVRGEGKRFKGLHTYRNEIIELLKNPEKRPIALINQKVAVLYDEMQNHATNLSNKLYAFKQAYDKAESGFSDTGKLWAVSGVIDPAAQKLNPNTRKMKYTVQEMTRAEFDKEVEERREAAGISFLTEISSSKQTDTTLDSRNLINALEEEVKLGRSAWEAVKTYPTTSIAKNEAKAQGKAETDSEFLAGLDKIEEKIGRPTEEISDEKIADIKDPQKKAKVKEGDIVNVVDQDGSLITPKPVPITKMLGKGPDGIEYVQVEGSSAGYQIDRIVPVKSETKARPKGTSIPEEIAKLKEDLKRVRQLKEEKAKKDKLGSAPDEDYDKQEREILRKIEELEALERQAGQQPTEDTGGDGADEVFDETTKTSKSSPDSAEQLTQETGTDAETETKTKAGKVQDFIASTIKKYWPVILKASAKNRERIMGMLGTFFTDLVQIGDIENVPGLHTLQDTDFIWTDADIESGRIRKPQKLVGTFSWQKLRDALTGLGVDKATAKHIAQQYGKFKNRYENIAVALKAGSNVRIIDSEDTRVYEIVSINSEGIAKLELKKDEPKKLIVAGKELPIKTSSSVEQLFDAKQFALGEPLSILLRPYNNSKTEQVGKLPDQILLGMYLGALSFRTKNPTNTRFTSDWQRKQFLYSGKKDPNKNEITELEDIGHGFNEAADSIGKDVAKSLQLSAKKIAKDHPTLTQDSADLYYARLLPALGMMALDIAAGKDSEAWFGIENKVFNFLEAKAKDRNFNNPKNKDDDQTYRHIKYPEKKKSKEELIALAEDKSALEKITEQLDMKLDSYGEVLREPVDTPTRIKRSLKKVPRKVRKALEKLHNAKWNISETADSVVVLNKSDAGKDLLNRLMGVLSTEGDMHQRQRDSYEAANRDKQNDLKSFLEANEAGELKDFYFAYELQGHHRILQQGKINPQNSKVTRFLLQSWGAQTYNKNNLWKFKLAVAQNFGLDVDKNKLAWAETQFDHIVNNGHVQEAVKAMQALNENKDDKAAASKLAEAVSQIKSIDDYKDANIQLLTAITALAKYMPSGDPIRAKAEFKSDIVMEIDGITNGFAMNLLQFPIFDSEQLETHLNQTGTWYDVRSSHDPTIPDVYMTLIDHIKEGDTDDKALDWYIENAWKSDFVSEAGRYTKGTKKKPPTPQQEAENARTLAKYPEMYKARSEALRSLVPDLHLYNKKMRKTVKYPFMIYMYGGGTKSIAQGVASDVVDGFYEEVTALHNMWQAMQKGTVAPEDRKYLNELGIITRKDYKNKMMAFVDNLEKLGAFEGNKSPSKEEYKQLLLDGKALDVDKNGKALHNFNDTELTQVIGRTVEPRFEHGLSSMLGSTKNARSDVIKMGQMMHRMFMLKYETAYQKKLDKINAEYKASLSEEDKRNFVPLDRLTEKQITEMVAGQNAELAEVIPQAAGPLAQILLDRETGKEYTDGALDLSSTESVRGNEKLAIRSDKISNKMTPSENDNRPANRDIMEKQLGFVESGVSTLIRQIQNMDSVLLTQTFGGGNGKGDPRVNVGFTNNKWEGDGNVLPLHDAFMASPEQLSVISEIYGTAYIEYNKKYSIIETTFKQVQKIRKTLTPEEAHFLNQMYSAEEQNKQNPRDADDFIDEFKDRTEEVQGFRKLLFDKMKEKGVVSHQLYMPKPQGESITSYEESLEEIDAVVNEKEPLPGAEVDRPVLPFNDKNGDPVKVNDDQWRAMAQMETWWDTDIEDINNKIFVLQGRGGTGKTTIVEAALTKLGLNLERNEDGTLVLDPYDNKPISNPNLGEVKFALPTHKAKQVIKQAAGKYKDEDFTTIAGLLGEKPNYVPRSQKDKDTGKTTIVWKAQFEKDTELAKKALDDLKGVKVIVIDEASMVNEKDTTELIQIAEQKGIRLLFMGDNVQLPPIEQGGKGTVDVARVFDTAMGIGQKKPIPFEPKHYAQLKQRMRQDADNPILAITDILANVAEWIHKKHTSYKKLEHGKNRQLYFELPLINNKNVKYMEGNSYNGATKNTIKAFADDYKAARLEGKEGGVKYIHYQKADHKRSASLRTKIRKAIFGDADPGIFEKPYLKGERIVLDDSVTLLNKDGEVQNFTKDLHNGDEVTVQKELYTITAPYKDGKDRGENKAPVYKNISVDILEVKLDGSGVVYKLVLENAQSKEDIVKGMIRNRKYGIFKGEPGTENIASNYTGKDKFLEGRVVKEMFTEDLGAAYIINAHKSQGSTYDTVYADYENMLRGYHGADFLTRVKALYVATSRPRTKLVMVGDAGVMGLNLSFGDGDLIKEGENANVELIDANQEILENVVNKETSNLDDLIEEEIEQIIKSDVPPTPTPTLSWKDLDSFLNDGLTDAEQNAIDNLARFAGDETILEYINNPQSLKSELKSIESQAREDEARAEADEEFGMNEDGDAESAESAVINKGLTVLHKVLVKKGVTDKLGSLGSMDDLPNEPTGDPRDLGVIGKGNFKKLFDQFKQFSTNYYANTREMLAHSETLDTVLGILSEGITEIGGINLSLQEVQGITQGEYDIANRAMKINLSNSVPYSVNQSPQEVYVHELLHATTALGIRQNPLIVNRVERVYVQTKRAIDAKYGKGSGYKVFLTGINTPSENDIAMARKQYNYVFAGREKDRIHEFLAYAATNRQMIEFLKTQPKPVREGILDNIIGIITDVMNFLKESFGARTYAAKGNNAFAEILAATEHLVAVQAKHESMLDRLNAYTYNKLDQSDEFLKRTGENVFLKLQGKEGETPSRLRQAVFGAAGGIYATMTTNEATIALRQKIDQKLNKTLRGIANEIGDGALTKEMIEQLLYVKVNISKARQQAETFTMSWFNGNKKEDIEGIWKSVKEDGMDVKTKVALTRVVFQTDLSVLLNEDNEWAMTPAEIMDLIGHAGRSRRATLKARIAKELKLSHKSDALSYAKELGYWIATGNTRLDDSHTNVSTIAAQYFTNPTAAEVNLLDMYSTLSALDYTDANHNEAVLKLARAEFMDNPDRNGISDLLKSHRTYKENIRADNFEENEMQLVKGYIVERVDNFTSIKMGRADQAKEMKERGYSESYPVRKVDPRQTIDTMYVTRTTPEVTDVSGVMSTTNQRNMGTTLTEILVRDPAYHFTKGPNKGKPNFYIIKAAVDKFIKAKSRAAKSNKTFKWDDSLTMRPLRDQNGNITDYRVMMNHADVEQIIRPDLQVDHVFAHMRSSAVDRKETIESDKKTVELLVYEQLELMEASPDISWINIMDPNSPYIDRFRKLPKAVRKHMEEYAKGGRFFVREDIIDKVFGYKSFDLSELKMLQDDDTSFKRITKRAAGLTHHAIKQTVGYGKNRVVIAMPKVVVGNMLSNIYQLTMRKIPLDYIFHKIVEGVHEYNKYRKDTERRTKLKHEIESQKLDPDTSSEAVEMRQLDDRIKGNLIHRLSKAGLNSLIVEDINDAQTDGWINKLQKTIPYSFPRAQKFIDKIPSELGDVARFLFMTKGSKPYQISRHIVQMTDFLARYVMIEHATKVKGQGFKEAVHESLDAFVVFDEAMIPALETLEAVGATSFLSYYLRNARASRKLVAQSPTGVALAAAAQHTTGIPVLGNVNSSWLAGRFTPNTLQTDDLFDEANNVSLFEIVKDVNKDLFN